MGKTHKQSIFDDKFLFQKAYKKLKSDAYYDKTKVILKKQHFTTFTLPRKSTKPVYTRPALSPLDFLRFGL